MCTLSVNDVNYHKFSHGAASYMLNEKNVNVMLEYNMIQDLTVRETFICKSSPKGKQCGFR